MEKDLERELEILNAKLDNLRKSSTNENEISLVLLEIGSVYYLRGKNDEALKYYNQFIESKMRPKQISIETAIYTIAIICYYEYYEGKFELALNYNNQSLETEKQSLPLNHGNLAAILNNIGLAYEIQAKYEEALKYFNQSLEVKKQTLPSNDFLIAKTLDNIRLAYEKLVKCYNHSERIVSQTPEETINAGNLKEELLKANGKNKIHYFYCF